LKNKVDMIVVKSHFYGYAATAKTLICNYIHQLAKLEQKILHVIGDMILAG
jgi:hypothetical protein